MNRVNRNLITRLSLLIISGILLNSCDSDFPRTELPPETDITSSNSLPGAVFGLEAKALSTALELPHFTELGVAWIRINGILWSDIEPVKGQMEWAAAASLEQDILNASEAGIEVVLIVRSTPEWAQQIPNSFCGPIATSELGAFADFLVELVTRYSRPPYNVGYWELWNEPDIPPHLVPPKSAFGCWGDDSAKMYGGEYYAEMLKTAYRAIKSVDPESQVLVGGLLLDCDPRNPPVETDNSGAYRDCSAGNFFEGILEAGGAAYFDGVSFHAYDYYFGEEARYGNPNWNIDARSWGPSMLPKIAFLKDLLARYGATNKYLINSEQALLCISNGEQDPCKTVTFETTKAIYLVQSFATAMSQDLRANFWYSLRGWRSSGLVNLNMEPNPAYLAYQYAADQLGNSTYISAVTRFPGISGHRFQVPNSEIWVLWSNDGNPHTVKLPATPTVVTDMYGHSLEYVTELVIENEPVYIFGASLNYDLNN